MEQSDLSDTSLQDISYALTDMIGQARQLRLKGPEEANRIRAEIPRIFRLKAMKLAQMGSDALADAMLALRAKMRNPNRINPYDDTYLECLIAAEKTLPRE